MDQYLYKFLVMYGRLALPQLGTVAIEEQPASFDSASGNLQAPRPVIRFSEDETQLAERQLLSFLANETGEEETDTTESFMAFIRSFKKTLTENGKAVISGVGSFEKNADNPLEFEPAVNIDYLLPDIHTGELLAVEDEIVEKKDIWWFYALILLILGLGALAYYYI